MKSFLTKTRSEAVTQYQFIMAAHGAFIGCNLKDFKTCNIAGILKHLLKRMDAVNDGDTAPKLDDIMSSQMKKENISTTKLLDYFHHLKYDHGLHDDNKGHEIRFDEAYDFFTESIGGNRCDVNQCIFVKMHYRDRFADKKEEFENVENLMDKMAMIHCYILHSYDINRLTKEERDVIDREVEDVIKSRDDEKQIDSKDVDDDEEYSAELWRVSLINDKLTEKQERFGHIRARFGGNDENEDDKMKSDQLSVNFMKLSESVNLEVSALRDKLGDYEMNRDELISELIDVVYSDNAKATVVWGMFNMNDKEKEVMFQRMLHHHFKHTQLNTENFLKISGYFVKRKRFKIDMIAFSEVINEEQIDGKMYDEMNKYCYQDRGKFATRFESVSSCHGAHIRQLYNLVRKWRFIKAKPPKKMVKPSEPQRVIKVNMDHPLLTVNISELTVAALSQWFRDLPITTEGDDGCRGQMICDKLSRLVYQHQIYGSMLGNDMDFTENDFMNLLDGIQCDFKYEDCEWIWQCITRCQRGPPSAHNRMQWIESSWNRYLSFGSSELDVDSQFTADIDFEQKGNVEDDLKSELKSEQETKPDHLVYSEGKRFYFWQDYKNHPDLQPFVKAKYQNMKEDITQSPLLSKATAIVMDVWNNTLQGASDFVQTEKAKKMNSSPSYAEDIYPVAKGKSIDLEHVHGLKLYTDCDKLCAVFCAILRRGDPEEVAEIANWCRVLIETVQCFGTEPANAKQYWRGVNRTFMFNTIVTQYNLPISTSSSV